MEFVSLDSFLLDIYTLESFVHSSLSQVLLGETQQIMGDQKTQ